MYGTLLETVDLFVFVGGRDGVLRLGLLSHFTGHPFVTTSSFGGAAKELAESFYGSMRRGDYYQNIGYEDSLKLGNVDLDGDELFTVAQQALRNELLFAVGQTIKGRMRPKQLLKVVSHTFTHIVEVVGRAVVVVSVAAVLYVTLNVEIKHLWHLLRESILKVGGE
jgi:hypothetical protein